MRGYIIIQRDRVITDSMEVNPLYTALDDLQARTDVLRGYL